jgi:hypothetical protein
MLVFFGVEVATTVFAQYDWRRLTDSFTFLSLAMILICLVYGFTANIGKLLRALWLLFMFGYIAFWAIVLHKFYTSAD